MRIGGLATGMDIDQLVKDLMSAERMPLDKLTQQKIWTEWQQDSYRDFNLTLSNLRTSASTLRFSSAFNAYSATTSNLGSLSVTTTSSAVQGTYQAEVKSIASSAKLHSASAITKADGTVAKSTDLIGVDGNITVTGSSGAITVAVTAGMTYKEVATKMQDATAASTPALRVSYDDTTSRFFVSTKGMGATENFTLDFDSAALAKQVVGINTQTSFSTATASSYSSAATSGSVELDGILIDGLTTNQTTVNGLVLNLVQVGGPSTINVSSDTAKPLESIKSFVEQYNKAITEIETSLLEKRYPDFQPLTDDQKKAMSEKEIELWEEKSRSGLMRNDPILREAVLDLRRAFMDEVEGIAPGNISLLSQIGISTGHYSEGARLNINEDKLKKALADKPDEVMQLFTNKTGGLGIGDRVYNELNSAIKSLGNRAGNPGSAIDNSVITKKIKQMNEDISKWQDRLTRVEDRYWKQFSAMEKAMNQMNQQSSWMQQNMFGGM
ncbi:flagellar filament capping protein FliD [Paenisporosarcina sp.]|uniref:flagellar filament capping protein FliD n=1 Tax=Paenisporosarcina sp. TaxID=1932001 RepID=UPI003C75FE0D